MHDHDRIEETAACAAFNTTWAHDLRMAPAVQTDFIVLLLHYIHPASMIRAASTPSR